MSSTFDEKKELLDIRTNSSLHLELQDMDLDTFWISIAHRRDNWSPFAIPHLLSMRYWILGGDITKIKLQKQTQRWT